MSNNKESLAKVIPVGATINRYMFDFVDGTGSFNKSTLLTKKSSKVLLNNGKKIVLDDNDYSGVAIVEGYGIQLEKPAIHMRVDDSLFGNTLNVLLYTEKVLTIEGFSDIIHQELQKKFESWRDSNFRNISQLESLDEADWICQN